MTMRATSSVTIAKRYGLSAIRSRRRRHRRSVRREAVYTALSLIFLVTALGFAGGCDKADAAQSPFYGVMESGSASMLEPSTWQTIKESGAGIVRVQVCSCEAAQAEAEMSLAAAYNIEVLPYFNAAPETSPQALAELAVFVRGFVSRYQYVKVWESGNEPNVFVGADPVGAATVAATIINAIRAADPTAEVVAPGLYTGLQPRAYLHAMDARLAELNTTYDAVSVHPYVLLDEGHPLTSGDVEAVAAETVKAVRSVQRLHPSKPVYVTEIGWPAHDYTNSEDPTVTSPRLQAQLVEGVLGALYAARGELKLRRVIYYAIADNPAMGGWPGGAGLTTPTGKRRPSFAAFQQLALDNSGKSR